MNVKRSTLSLYFIILITTSFGLMADSCSKKVKNNIATTPLQPDIPEGFPKPVYDFENNPLTEEGFALGRKLFYDGRLSIDGNFPCASCHQQFAAFSSYDHSFSHGFNNAFTTRNAPGLFNEAWQSAFHLDGGINNLEVQPLAPITAPNEMAESIENIIRKLNKDDVYRQMFRSAFGDDAITSQRMLKALAQFTVSLVSADSKYDRFKKGLLAFTPYEERGYALFKQKCATCHTEPLFTDGSFRNIGLPAVPGIDDLGRMKITGDPADSLKFKVPSLRNVNITVPYMHDGRFASLEACLQHYNNGVVKSATVDPLVADGIHLSNTEVVDMVAFLRTLTDTTLTKNPRFADPEHKAIFSPDRH
ncbi:MAG: cytochrome-c peroxidase [Terrimonas sp.]|nr:cytochrome-c peroxidase [Terrimonas sp.]